MDDYAWVGGAPDAFRSADVFVATEPSLAELRGDYIKHAEDAGLPVIRKAELGDLYLEAAKSSNLAIVREPSWESLEAARLTSRMQCRTSADRHVLRPASTIERPDDLGVVAQPTEPASAFR